MVPFLPINLMKFPVVLVLASAALISLVSVAAAAGRLPPPPTQVLSFTQTADHFRFVQGSAPRTFAQKVLTFDDYWRAPDGPLLVYFGNEGEVGDFYNNSGALFEIAERVGGRVVFLEHRYYGESLVFGDRSYDSDKLYLLTIEQALADMSHFLSSKRSFLGCSNETGACPVVLFGGSYGGMLAAWFMLKYPQHAVGALAASAPVDLYPGEDKATKFFDAGMFVYGKFGSAGCEAWIRAALKRVAALGAREGGRALLTRELNTCAPLKDQLGGDKTLLYVNGALSTMAMVDYPFATSFVTPMPASPVNFGCNATRALTPDSTDLELVRGLKSMVDIFTNFTGQIACHNVSAEMLATPTRRRAPIPGPALASLGGASLGDISRPWNYQACTELILEPLTSNGDGFFVENDAQITEVEAACREQFAGVVSRPNWLAESFGNGAQLVKATHNIIFSDGEKDPWRVGGVPDDAASIGDGTVVHLLIEEGAHHQDLRFASEKDPEAVTAAKKWESDTIAGWLKAEEKGQEKTDRGQVQ